MRRKHGWKIPLGLTLATILVASIGWRWVQQHARERVKTRLEKLSGTPVEVDDVRLGLFGVQVSGLKLGLNSRAWMTVQRMYFQLPLWKALRGQSRATRVDVDGPTLRLRFNRQHQLITRIPTGIDVASVSSRMNIKNGRVVLTQDDRQPLIANAIDLRIGGPNNRIDGQIGDLLGTVWKVESDVNGGRSSTRIRVSADTLLLDTRALSKHARIPAGLINQFHVVGATSASIAASYDVGKPLKWQLDLRPRSMTVHLPALGMRLDHLAGKLRLDDRVLAAEELSCRFLDGAVTASGQLDFRAGPPRGQCTATINGVFLDRLPTEWSVPREVVGVFGGKVDVQLAVKNNALIAVGTGRGVIDQASLWGMPVGAIQTTAEIGQLTYDLAKASVAADGVLTLDLETDDLAVSDVLSRLSVPDKLRSMPMQGQASVTAQFHVPLDSIGDREQYQASADVSLAELSINDERLSNVSAQVNYANGVANIESLDARVAEDGGLSGSAAVHIGGAMTGQGLLEQMPVSLLAKWLPKPIELSGGKVTGEIRLHGFADRWLDITAWEGQGQLRSDELMVNGQALTDVVARLELRTGAMLLTDLRAQWNDAAVRGNATVNTAAPHSYVAHVEVAEMAASGLLATLQGVRQSETINAQVSVRGDVCGQLTPLMWSAAGSGRLREAKLAGLTIPETDFAWRVDPESLQLTANDLRMLSGQFEMRAELPFSGDRVSQATITARRFNVSEAATAIGGLPISLMGEADGQLTITNFEDIQRMAATGNLKGAAAQVRTISVKPLAADFSVSDGVVKFRSTGVVLGGHVEFTGSSHLDMLNTNRRVNGQLTVRDARLSRLAGHFGKRWRNRLSPLDGQLAAEMQVVSSGAGFSPEGKGSITLLDVTWDRRELATRATAAIDLTSDEIHIRNIDAIIGDGSVLGELSMNLNMPQPDGSLHVTASRVNVKRLLAPWPTISQEVEGTVNARIRGNLGTSWTGTGQLSAVRASVMNVPVSLSRVPIDWSYWPSSARGRLKVRETAVQLAGGRAMAKTTIDWGRTLNVSIDARLAAMELQSLLRPALGNSGTADGRLSGTLQLRGRNVRSFQNLQGSFTGTLDDAQALRLPVLRTMNRFLDAGQFSSSNFDSSEVKIRLAKGVVNIDRLAMANRGVQLLIDGKVVGSGRLDLNVTAHAGQFDSQPELRRLLRSAGLLAPTVASVAVLAEANEFLSDRLIFLHVGGTIRSPTTRLRAAPLLQQEAVRFFLNRASGAQ